ncbi:GabD3 succinate-semialdehyde dehdyrogenase [Frigidibacter mobilis]|uniref:GabD3 succinate-semialdehyde dehdyrogenase n=1 Tax=Frigidibacter mobilis TaxID=1335048 RepID=A0A159Z7F3_9RHOB|nr:GabD3 succinate-semialdehyde dehdyrogenase [Frigidibacter mobilis]
MTLDSPHADLADPGLHARGLYIGGAWLPGRGIPVTNPSTAAVLAEVPDATIADAMRAVDAAEAAAAGWRATPPRQRAEILRHWFGLMTDHAEDLARLISLENGKALPDARGEVAYAAEFFRWYAEEAVRIPGEFRHAPSGAHDILVGHDPIGIAVLITPWNFPAAMATRKIGPALAAGCTVILSPPRKPR